MSSFQRSVPLSLLQIKGQFPGLARPDGSGQWIQVFFKFDQFGIKREEYEMKVVTQMCSVLFVAALIALGVSATTMTAQAQYQRPYRMSDWQVKQLIQQTEDHAKVFRQDLAAALDDSRFNGTVREDVMNTRVKNFEDATRQLRDRFNERMSASDDVQNVLNRAARIDEFMRHNLLNRPVQNDWSLLRSDLSQLASTYNVAWDWNNLPYVPATAGFGGPDALLTGTYQLDKLSSDDPSVAADRATRNLPYPDEQRIYNNVVNRLGPPDELAIERHGRLVTLASTRAPEVTIDADGIERVEHYPNGHMSHVTASFNGNELMVSSTGDRPSDFTVNFEPLDGGQRLLVTRRIYADLLSQPIVVHSYYKRVSEIAQLNLYQVDRMYPITGAWIGNFLVPDGTTLIAVLNQDLTTQNTRNGDRFTMTVQSPSAYSGDIIEGYVSNINEGGHLAGRAEMTLNFEHIRLPDGRTYRFTGLVDGVRTIDGENARVDNEGAIESGSQTNRTIERSAIGSAIGAIIGAIAGGGQGAAIGAGVGAGAGLGSVYVQGRDNLDLMRGTTLTIQASAPRYSAAR